MQNCDDWGVAWGSDSQEFCYHHQVLEPEFLHPAPGPVVGLLETRIMLVQAPGKRVGKPVAVAAPLVAVCPRRLLVHLVVALAQCVFINFFPGKCTFHSKTSPLCWIKSQIRLVLRNCISISPHITLIFEIMNIDTFNTVIINYKNVFEDL